MLMSRDWDSHTSSLSWNSCTKWRENKDPFLYMNGGGSNMKVQCYMLCWLLQSKHKNHNHTLNTMLKHNKLYENEQTQIVYNISRIKESPEGLPKPLFSCGLTEEGHGKGSCPAPFSCSDGDMLSLPTLDQSLVVLGYAQVLQPERKLVLC